MTPRVLTSSDLPQALGLSSSAGWNQTAADWQRLLDLAPRTCFGVELDGCLAATATLFPYGRGLAWLGMVLTRRDFQHQGLASVLVAHCLEIAGALGIETVKLDATDQGQPIYEKLGFVDERGIERWAWSGVGGASGDTGVTVPLASLASLDYEAFGADRLKLLALLTAPVATENGFAFWRPGHFANYLGPCVAQTRDAARRLLTGCLAQAGGAQPAAQRWLWDVFPDNAPALELARDFGFQPVRRLVRMRRGPAIAERTSLVYAAAGFELG
ncbi:MAG: GNAT family N-acetyltransferase [Bryobacteraceae bacterium]|nr:GNAT family N-acetyltransferase [Bryobacteraceae bacterium]